MGFFPLTWLPRTAYQNVILTICVRERPPAPPRALRFFWSVKVRRSDAAKTAPRRPAGYRAEVADAICCALAEGASLIAICRTAGMPSPGTVRGWASADVEGFAARYARAREAQAEHLADEILEIADDRSHDWVPRKSTRREADEGGEAALTVNREHITRSRLRVDARKWLLAKMYPGKYGERVQYGNDPDNPLSAPVNERELAKSIVAALARATEADGEGGEEQGLPKRESPGDGPGFLTCG